MKYAIFLGCTIPARSRNYELSARKVAHKLGIELVDIEDFLCCGFPLKSIDERAYEFMGAYNLCLAQSQGLNICTLCSSCAAALEEIEHRLLRRTSDRDRANERLSRVGFHYEGGVQVRHFARILFEKVGWEEIGKYVIKDLGGLKIAIHYGCHYLKPSEIHDHFDDVENPRSIEKLLSVTGVRVLNYSGENTCCGGSILAVDENAALAMAKYKLDRVSEAGADALCVVCPFCSVMYDANQKSIESEYHAAYQLPVLYLPQILGLAMGFGRKDLGLDMNVVKTRKLLDRYFE